jgi:hypothetical protein
MPKINTAATGHGSKTEHYADGSSIRFNVFPEASDPEKKRLALLRKAVNIVDRAEGRMNIDGQCNNYFKTLGRTKTFRELWADDTIFINFSPSVTRGFYAAAHSNNKDVTVTAWCLDNNNFWMVAATLVHEFAHLAGAPGGASHAAERAVKKCYFNDQYDPTIVGSVQKLSQDLKKLAA